MWLDHPLQKADAIKKLTTRLPGFSQSLTLLGCYTLWILLFKLLSLTFVTYFVMSSSGLEGSHFEDVNEALSSNGLALLALCSMGFLLGIRLLNPYTTTPAGELFTPERFEKQFLPGFLNGSVLAAGVTLAFLISGIYRYLGFFVQIDHAPLAVAALLIRIASIGVFVYCEEFIFRHKVLLALTRRGPSPPQERGSEFWYNVGIAALLGVIYAGLKFLQFDLSWMQAATLFLVSISLGLRALSRNDFIMAAGFWSSMLIVFHALLSLPIFGHDFSGLILIKYQAIVTEPSPEFWRPESTYGETIRFLTGGAGGPLASFAFQVLMCFDIFRGALRYRRKLGI